MEGIMVDGVFILCPMLPEHFATLDRSIVLKKIIKCVMLAKNLGAGVATLGGFTSIFSDQGINVASRRILPVTTGNTLTAALVLKSVLKAVDVLGYDLSQLTVGVVGAAGDIGSACARALTPLCKKIIFVSREQNKIQKFASTLQESHKVCIYADVENVAKEADVLITATSSITTLISEQALKAGAIVCDVSLPPNIARGLIRQRNDVLVFEGGYANLPFFDNIKNLEFKKHFRHGAVFGCLAEGIILAMEKRFENFSLGRGGITLEKMKEINTLAEKHGFTVAPFFCSDKKYTENDFMIIRNHYMARKDQHAN